MIGQVKKPIEEILGYLEGKKKIVIYGCGGCATVSTGMAKWMNENIPGIFVPQNLIDELTKMPKGEGLSKGIEIA